MQSDKVLKYTGITVVVGLVGYFAFWLKKQTDLLAETCFKMGKLKIVQLGINNTILSVQVLLKNLSKVNLTITNQVYEMYLNDTFIAKIESAEILTLRPNVEQTTNFETSFSPREVLRNITGDFIFGFNDMVLRVRMAITFDLGLISWTVKYTYRGMVKDLVKGFTAPTEGSTNTMCE
jgi:LEA14-like dessication related protein